MLNPGHKLVWHISDTRGNATADLMSLQDEDPRTMPAIMLRHPTEHFKYRTHAPGEVSEIEPLLVDILGEGKLVRNLPPIDRIPQVRQAVVARLDPGVRRLVNPHGYHVSLTQRLWDLKQEMAHAAKSAT